MTDLSRRIFREYQVRKGKQEKFAFIGFLCAALAREGISARLEVTRSVFTNRNIVIGNPDKAKIVIGAHYDTCAVLPLPNFITPRNVTVYILYQFFLAVALILIAFIISYIPVVLGWIDGFFIPLFSILMLASALLLTFGPANRHTANDNTSGVIGVIETVLAMPEELREKVVFVLFDNEELGLLGSAGFAKKHMRLKNNACMINLDCVSDGDVIMLALPKNCAAEYKKLLEESFVLWNDREVVLAPADNTFYPSDQMNFKHGAAVAALRKTKGGMLYMDKLHTAQDTVFDERNITFIREALIRLAGLIA